MKKLLRCFFSWRVKYPSWEMVERVLCENTASLRNVPVVILTHDVGLCKGNKPGCGNVLMARVLKRVAEKYPTIPVLAQLGVSLAAKEIGVSVAKTIGPPEADTPLDHSTGNYNSKTVIEEQKCWLEERNMFPTLALTLAIPLHMGRVKWIMEKEGFTVLPVPLLSLRSRDYCDKESLYFSIRVAGKYPGGILILHLRELAARLLFLKNGWM